MTIIIHWNTKVLHLMKSECSKLPQKDYKTRHEWVGKVIHWELCKKLKFDHTTKWYIEWDAYNSLGFWDTDHLILVRRRDLVIIKKKKKKKTCRIVAVQVEYRDKIKENEKRDKYLHLGRELRKLWNMRVTVIPTGVLGTTPKAW